MKRLLFFLVLCSSIAYSQMIQRIEYYIDEDPGYGLGSQVSFVQDVDVTTSFNVKLSDYSDGFHVLYVRAEDNYGVWSLPMVKPFLKERVSLEATPSPIVALEYYIDEDPGFGMGTQVDITSRTDVNTSFAVDLTYIKPGFHILYVRAKNDMGVYSLTYQKPFLVEATSLQDAPPMMAQMEYFIDEDPGFGNGISIPIVGSNDVTTKYSVDLSEVSAGFHVLYVRAKDEHGAWSLSLVKPFLNEKVSLQDPTPQIVQMEYFIDEDPGYGNAMQVPIEQADNIELSFIADAADLADGFHLIHVRMKDEFGNWSLVYKRPFTIQNSIDPETPPLLTTVRWRFLGIDSTIYYGDQSFTPSPDIERDYSMNLEELTLDKMYHLELAAIDEYGVSSMPVYHEFEYGEFPNQPPVLEGLPDIAFHEDSSYSLPLNPFVTDEDHDSTEITFSFAVLRRFDNIADKRAYEKELSEGEKNSVENDSSDSETKKQKNETTEVESIVENDLLIIEIDSVNVAHFRTPYDVIGIYQVEFTATDDSLASDTDTMWVNVTPDRYLQLLSQQGGEEYFANSDQEILWMSRHVDKVLIELSPDGGQNWIPVVERYPGKEQVYPWYVNDAPSENCLIRISNADSTELTDGSPEPFTIIDARKFWTGNVDSLWNNPENWNPPELPHPDNNVIIPETNINPVIQEDGDIVINKVHIESRAWLSIYYGLEEFVVDRNLLINGTFALIDSANAQINVGGDWITDPIIPDVDLGFLPGHSVVSFTDSGSVQGTFFIAWVDTGANVTSSGNIFVLERMSLLGGNLSMNPGDTLIINNDDPGALVGDGKVLRGSVFRRIRQNEDAPYMFESMHTFVQFSGNKRSPNSPAPGTVVITTYPDTLAENFSPYWRVIPSRVDTLNNAVIADSVRKFTIWTIGDGNFGNGTRGVERASLRRVYSGTTGENKRGSDAPFRLSLRYEESEIPIGTEETELKILEWIDPTGVEDDDEYAPEAYSLQQNYPNPFNPETSIEFSLPLSSKVSLIIYNTLGEQVEILMNKELASGLHRVVWDAKRHATGIYFYTISANALDGSKTFRETKKMLLLK